MKKTLAALGIAALLVACGKTETAVPAAATKAPAAPAAPATQTYASDDPTETPAAQVATLSGTVVETMNGGGYTYMKIKSPNGESWVATPQVEVKKGQQVSIVAQMTAKQFESATLKRKFDEIVFGTLDNGTAPAAAAAAPAAMPAGHPKVPGGMPPAMASAMGSPADHMQAKAAVAEVKVEKAEGPNAKTVAEIWSGKAALGDKPVVVRGTVVKFLGGIMGKNWLHLRDGSGSAANGDHDITVTTNDMAKVGDVVVVSGTVRVDKDFGAGYRYPAIIEDASIK